MAYLKYLAYGLLFSAPVEFFNQVFMQKAGIRGFLATELSYAVILSIWFPVIASVSKRLRSRAAVQAFNYAAFGALGLMIEWFLIGNSPWLNPAANQVGMLGWWGLLGTFPFIVSEGAGSVRLKSWTWGFWAVLGMMSLALPLAVSGEAGEFLGLVAVHYGFTFANIFPIWYIARLRKGTD